MGRITVNHKGQRVEGEELRFEPVSEPWSVYALSDGATAKIRPVATRVVRLDEPGPDGDPVYAVSWQGVVVTSTLPAE